jgi:hypothetical protein
MWNGVLAAHITTEEDGLCSIPNHNGISLEALISLLSINGLQNLLLKQRVTWNI